MTTPCGPIPTLPSHWLVTEGPRVDFPMSVDAVAMNLSTIIVAANAQLLRRLKLQRAAS